MVLNLRLGDVGRHSLDIDSNLTPDFISRFPDRDTQRDYLKDELTRALLRQFERADPVRYSLVAVTVRPNPPMEHRRGWNAFKVSVTVQDLKHPGVRGLPSLTLDLAAPEQLLSASAAPLAIGGWEVTAYTLERMAGEKLRAFLSSPPTYRLKVLKPGRTVVRAKDIYDLYRILKSHPLEERDFWRGVGDEFVSACESRFVDCDGMSSFEDALAETREAYAKDRTVPDDVPFDVAWRCVSDIVGVLGQQGRFPLEYPLDDDSSGGR